MSAGSTGEEYCSPKKSWNAESAISSGSAEGEPEGVVGPLEDDEEERLEKPLEPKDGVREGEKPFDSREGVRETEEAKEEMREGGETERSVDVSDVAGLTPRWFAARFGVRRGGPATFLRLVCAGTSVTGCAYGLGERKGCCRERGAAMVLRDLVARTADGGGLLRTSAGMGAVKGMTVVAIWKGGDRTGRIS
jgi:hypothetical protein